MLNQYGVKSGCNCYRIIDGIKYVSIGGQRIKPIVKILKEKLRTKKIKIRITSCEMFVPEVHSFTAFNLLIEAEQEFNKTKQIGGV